MTTITRDDDSKNIYTVTVVLCNQHTLVEEYKYGYKLKNALIVPGESISNKEPIKISGKNNVIIHCSCCTYLILSKRQSQFMYFIILGISITLYG